MAKNVFKNKSECVTRSTCLCDGSHHRTLSESFSWYPRRLEVHTLFPLLTLSDSGRRGVTSELTKLASLSFFETALPCGQLWIRIPCGDSGCGAPTSGPHPVTLSAGQLLQEQEQRHTWGSLTTNLNSSKVMSQANKLLKKLSTFSPYQVNLHDNKI